MVACKKHLLQDTSYHHPLPSFGGYNISHNYNNCYNLRISDVFPSFMRIYT